MREYEKYEFCKSVKCPELKTDETGYYHCGKADCYCKFTAKDFYKWVKRQGFKILRKAG